MWEVGTLIPADMAPRSADDIVCGWYPYVTYVLKTFVPHPTLRIVFLSMPLSMGYAFVNWRMGLATVLQVDVDGTHGKCCLLLLMASRKPACAPRTSALASSQERRKP